MKKSGARLNRVRGILLFGDLLTMDVDTAGLLRWSSCVCPTCSARHMGAFTMQVHKQVAVPHQRLHKVGQRVHVDVPLRRQPFRDINRRLGFPTF